MTKETGGAAARNSTAKMRLKVMIRTVHADMLKLRQLAYDVMAEDFMQPDTVALASSAKVLMNKCIAEIKVIDK